MISEPTFIPNYRSLLRYEVAVASFNMTFLTSLHPLIYSSLGDKKYYICGRRNRACMKWLILISCFLFKGKGCRFLVVSILVGILLLMKSCVHKTNLPNSNRPKTTLSKTLLVVIKVIFCY